MTDTRSVHTKMLLVGRDKSIIFGLVRALSLTRETRVIVRSELDLPAALEQLPKVSLVILTDFVLKGKLGGDTNADKVVDVLREAGYKGEVGACTDNPILNSYLGKHGGATFTCGEWHGKEEECPTLSIKELTEVIKPRLQAA